MYKIDLGTRMKRYEESTGSKLIPHLPTIIRIDGKNFHAYVKKINAEKPFDINLHDAMFETTLWLVSNMPNVLCAYTQSDEISILLCDFPDLNTEQWFSGKVQKIVSVAASMATAQFNYNINNSIACFDARVFQLPIDEINNYFVWRQQDATRNSINMLAQSLYSHEELQGIGTKKLQEKMFLEKEVNWDHLESWKKRGTFCVVNSNSDYIPIFSKETKYISNLIKKEYE